MWPISEALPQAPRKDGAVMHHRAAETDAQEKIEKIPRSRAPMPYRRSPSAAAAASILEEARQARGFTKALARRDILPTGHTGRTGETHPVHPKGAGQCKANSEDRSVGADGPQFCRKLSNEIESLVRRQVRRPRGAVR